MSSSGEPQVPKVLLQCAVGEDIAYQFFWTNDIGDSNPITAPVLADVRDANGQIAIRFATNNDPATGAFAGVQGANGFIQLTCPSAITKLLLPGRYAFDLWAAVADSDAAYFPAQLQQVVSGWLEVGPRVTKIEEATADLLTSMPGG